MRNPTANDWLILLALVAAWGSSFVMTKVAVNHMDPAWVMALRLVIAGAILIAVAVMTGTALPRPLRLWGWFTWLGIIGHAAPFFLISWGTQFVTSGLSGVLMGAIPLIVIVFAHVFLPDEPLTPIKALGFVIGFVGLMLVLGFENILAFDTSTAALKGELAILLGCLCYAAHGIFARKIPFHDPIPQSAAVCATGGVVGTCFALAVAPIDLTSAPPTALLSVLGLGILPTALATLFVYRIVRTAGVSFVAYSNYLVPIYALGFGALVLDEQLDWNVAVGLTLILVGIAASRLNLRKTKAFTS
jgi:drug/metabolite transporter (DMT)-like permease